jgi:hypothetical protein
MLLHSNPILLLKQNSVKLGLVICGLKCQSFIHMEKLYPSVSNVNMEAALNLLDMVLDLLSMLNQLVDVLANKAHQVHLAHLEMMVITDVTDKTVKMPKMDVMVMF